MKVMHEILNKDIKPQMPDAVLLYSCSFWLTHWLAAFS